MNYKQMISRLSALAFFGGLLAMSNLASASVALSEFTVSGKSSVVDAPEEAERNMTENAKAQCPQDTTAKQVSPTQFALLPKAFPTDRIATAQFRCQPNSNVNTEVAAAHAANIDSKLTSCNVFPGQLQFDVTQDHKTAQITQRNYALRDGPATDLARSLGVLPREHAPAIGQLIIESGAIGHLDFKLTDGSTQTIAVANLNISLGYMLSSDGIVEIALDAAAGSKNLIHIEGLKTSCQGL